MVGGKTLMSTPAVNEVITVEIGEISFKALVMQVNKDAYILRVMEGHPDLLTLLGPDRFLGLGQHSSWDLTGAMVAVDRKVIEPYGFPDVSKL